jgi:acetyl esterase
MADYEKLRQERFASLMDPVLKDYYTALLKRPALRELGVDGMRARFGQVDPAMLQDPDVMSEDMIAPGPHGPIPLRIFRPRTLGPEPSAIYLHIHHGGYVMFGGLDAMTPNNLRLAKSLHCIVVGVDFRLPPEHPFPIPLDDCFAAFQWTAAHAHELGGAVERIGIGGGCTGANLSTAVTILARDAGGPVPAAQCLFAPTFDQRCEYRSYYENSGPGYSLTRDDAWFVNHQYCQNWEQDAFDWRASPVLTPTLKGMPPTLIHVGEWDVLRDEAVFYANRLRDAGCDVRLIVQSQQSHAPTPISLPLLDREIAALLTRTIGSRPPP